MIMSVHKNIFFVYSLLCLESKIFALTLDYGYTLDQILDEIYKTPETIPRRMFYKKAIDDNAIILWHGIEHKKMKKLKDLDLNAKTPSVPLPKKRLAGQSTELRQRLYGRLFSRQNDRATQAGYTNNVDTCKLYNKNLEKVWMALAKFIGPNEEMLDSMALHNIILLVKAYLDHHSPLIKKDKSIQRETDNTEQGNISEILTKINEMLVKKLSKNDEGVASNIVALIISRTEKLKEKKSAKCNELSKKKLKFSVKRELQKFIEFSNCRRVNKVGEKARENFKKMSSSDAKKFLRHWEDDPETNCITVDRKTFLETMRAIINE